MQLLVSGVWCQLGEIQGCPTDCGQSVPLSWRVYVLQTGISACSQQPGTVHVEGILVDLKVIRAHSEKHQLNHVRLVLPVGGFA